MKKILFYFLFLFVFLFLNKIGAQSLPVGLETLEDYYRRLQLLGEGDEYHSFVIRPLFSSGKYSISDLYDPIDEVKKYSNFYNHFEITEKGFVKFLPVGILQQFSSHHPEGWNDGAMIPARGYQTKFSTGIYAEYGVLSLRLQPEFVYAENKSFDGFQPGYVNPLGTVFPASPYHNIDYPENFGDGSYNKLFWGQSSLRLNFGKISFGVSTENLWWGPGIYNSLLMSNTAPGFKHLTFNTVKPVETPVGSFEWQMVGGLLDSSGYTENLPDDQRYINAMVVSYQPKWMPGFFLGFIRSFTIYNKDIDGSLKDYLPVIFSFGKLSLDDNIGIQKQVSKFESVFMRWVWQKSHLEIYAEYGFKDNASGLEQLSVLASHSDAYILGFRKLFLLKKHKGQYIQLHFELTQLESSPEYIYKNAGSWYEHGLVTHGYTHQGQLLGAGIGPGSNLQVLNLSWMHGLRMIGLQFERYVHNNDFFFKYVKDIRENWVDISAAALARWDYKNMIFNLKLKFVSSLNYQWVYYPKLGDDSYFWDGSGWDVFNFYAQLGVIYRF